MRTDVGNKNITPTSMDEVVWVSLKFQIPPFGCKAIHGRTGLLLIGYKLNVMTHSLEKKSPQLPLGVKVLCSYATSDKYYSLTKKDSHPLPRICETLDSFIGAAYLSTFDLTSRFWQVPMAEESKQFTAFTLGSMGLFECERMPIWSL